MSQPSRESPDRPPLIEVRGLTKRYQVSRQAEPLTVLDQVGLSVPHGQSLAIVAPSGSGKTTLLNLIGALDRPTAGEVLLEGQPLSGMDDRALAHLRNRRLGFVFQAHHLLPQCTVLENALLPSLACDDKQRREEARELAASLLNRVGLADRSAHRPGELSGGQRQRVAVVRALVMQPSLVLADEPTGSLDQANAAELFGLLLELHRERGTALLVVTHATGFVTEFDRRLGIDRGKLDDLDQDTPYRATPNDPASPNPPES